MALVVIILRRVTRHKQRTHPWHIILGPRGLHWPTWICVTSKYIEDNVGGRKWGRKDISNDGY